MPVHAVIPAVITSQPQTTAGLWENEPAGPSTSRRVSYGATLTSPSSPKQVWPGDGLISPAEHDIEEDDGSLVYEYEGYSATWRSLRRLYLVVPLSSLLFLIGLILLVTFAWPPDEDERDNGQTYPHPFLWKPILIGIFASCTVQALRVPLWVTISWFPISTNIINLTSTVVHTLFHELVRLASVTLIPRSPTSGFHSAYYLGIGWGVAETSWGIVQGYDQLALYQDLMRSDGKDDSREPEVENIEAHDDEGDVESQEAMSDLERKVEILETVRARRDLEDMIGVPFPSIPLPLHILWRIDTLLLNLGLTLILSAFYFDPYPFFRDDPNHATARLPPHKAQSDYLWLVWALVAMLHVCISLAWKMVWWTGVGAVTWGGLIVSLGTFFTGLGAWGGLV